MIEPAFAIYFWGFLFLYGGAMYAITPRSRTAASFFTGSDDAGRPATEWALMCSIFISWIFAKSVTNAANLGAAWGVVGGLAYAQFGQLCAARPTGRAAMGAAQHCRLRR